MPTIGVILTHGEGSETKYCVVVKRWYPFKRGNYWELEKKGGTRTEINLTEKKEGTRINLTDDDLEKAFIEFTAINKDILYTNVAEVKTDVEIEGTDGTDGTVVNVSIKPRAFDYKYGFPKGGKNKRETDQACALRELEEETGIKSTDVNLGEELPIPGLPLYYFAKYNGDIKSNAPSVDHQHEIFKVLWLTIGQLNGIIKNELSKCPREFRSVIRELDEGGRSEPVYPLLATNNIITTPFGENELKDFSKFLPQGVLKRTEKEAVAIGETELKKRISDAIIKHERQKQYNGGGGKTRKNRKTRKTRKNRRNNKSIKNRKSRRNNRNRNKRTKRR